MGRKTTNSIGPEDLKQDLDSLLDRVEVGEQEVAKNSGNSPEKTWGTPESYWPFSRPVVEPTDEDRERFAALTVEQRWDWMIMMIRLLEQQFGHLMAGSGSARPNEHS